MSSRPVFDIVIKPVLVGAFVGAFVGAGVFFILTPSIALLPWIMPFVAFSSVIAFFQNICLLGNDNAFDIISKFGFALYYGISAALAVLSIIFGGSFLLGAISQINLKSNAVWVVFGSILGMNYGFLNDHNETQNQLNNKILRDLRWMLGATVIIFAFIALLTFTGGAPITVAAVLAGLSKASQIGVLVGYCLCRIVPRCNQLEESETRPMYSAVSAEPSVPPEPSAPPMALGYY